MSKDESAAASAAISARILDLALISVSDTVLLYLPKAGSTEPNVSSIVNQALLSGKVVGLPVVTSTSRSQVEAGRIEIRRHESPDDLTLSQWRIPEPLSGRPIPESSIDLAIVPALGAGRNMYRIGHGYGYYDELLGSVSCPIVCPVYSGCLIESVPFEDHDIPVDYIVTEHETIHGS